jgi:hypothetical protein
MTRGQIKLFQDHRKVKIIFVAIAGFDSGRKIRKSICHSGIPSIFAASLNDFGIASNALLKIKILIIVVKSGNASPKCVSISPNCLVIRNAGIIVVWKGINTQLRKTRITTLLPGNECLNENPAMELMRILDTTTIADTNRLFQR